MSAILKHTLEPHKWVSSYKGYLYNYTKQRINDAMVIEDLIQETFLAGLKSQHRFKGDATERTWLTGILKHKIIDHYRSINSIKGKVKKSMISDTELQVAYNRELTLDTLEDNETTRHIIALELEGVIQDGFQELTVMEKAVMQLKLIQYGTDEICETLQISRGSLWVATFRARQKLKK